MLSVSAFQSTPDGSMASAYNSTSASIIGETGSVVFSALALPKNSQTYTTNAGTTGEFVFDLLSVIDGDTLLAGNGFWWLLPRVRPPTASAAL